MKPAIRFRLYRNLLPVRPAKLPVPKARATLNRCRMRRGRVRERLRGKARAKVSARVRDKDRVRARERVKHRTARGKAMVKEKALAEMARPAVTASDYPVHCPRAAIRHRLKCKCRKKECPFNLLEDRG